MMGRQALFCNFLTTSNCKIYLKKLGRVKLGSYGLWKAIDIELFSPLLRRHHRHQRR